MHEIKNLLEEYDKAVIAEDVVKIASHFHDNFTLSTPTELWQLNNNSEFIANLTIGIVCNEKIYRDDI